MHVLLATPELAPYLKSGGIGEGLGALARELVGLGVRVTVALPAHPELREGAPAHGVELVVVHTPELAARATIYGDDMHDETNAARFAPYARRVVELACERAQAGDPFDVLHAHEWPCAMAVYLARERRAELARTRTVLTLHNLAHQGIFPPPVLAAFGLGPEHADDARLGFHGHVNFVKGGILAADAITTVSPTYAKQILRAPFGEMLEAVLARRADRLTGLVNGIDYAEWNPARDPHVAARFDADDPAGKAACKRALLDEVGLGEPAGGARPLVVSVGRVVEQKGSDLLADALPALARVADVLIAGGGDARLVGALEAATAREPRARYLGVVKDAMVHRLIAGADLVAMPSRFEPCGIVQMYAMRYGAIPVAARTGGLADTIADADDALARGTGFLYDEPTSVGLARAVERAARATELPAWRDLTTRAMRVENSWRRRAFAYRRFYEELTSR